MRSLAALVASASLHWYHCITELHPFVVVWLEDELECSGTGSGPETEAVIQRALQNLQTISTPERADCAMPVASELAVLSELGAAQVAVYLLDGSAYHFNPSTTLQVRLQHTNTLMHGVHMC